MSRIHAKIPVGTRVYHGGQLWARLLVDGTGIITAVADRPCSDGSWEYTVMATRDFSRRPGPGNPENRETAWNSCHCRRAWTAEQEDQLRRTF